MEALAGLKRSVKFWRLALPMVFDYARFLDRIDRLESEVEKGSEKSTSGKNKEAEKRGSAAYKAMLKAVRADYGSGPPVMATEAAVEKDWKKAISDLRAKASHDLATKWATHLKNSMETLGGLYIKVGQHIPAFPLTPIPYAEALAPLKDGVTPRPRVVIEPLLLAALGSSPKKRRSFLPRSFKKRKKPLQPSLLDAFFADFEWDRCLGAASIGQVHRAVLLDGRSVAVKVQYPEVARNFHVDIACFTRVVRFVARAQGIKLEKKWIDEATKTFLNELDFAKEAVNLSDMALAVKAWPKEAKAKAGHVRIPRLIEGVFDARKGVLLMDLMPGRSLNQCIREERGAVAKAMGVSLPELEATIVKAQRDLVDRVRLGDDEPAPLTMRAWIPWLWALRETLWPVIYAYLVMLRIRLVQKWQQRIAAFLTPATVDVVGPASSPFDASLVCDRLVYAVGRCILISGIFSADPHGANIIVREGNELSLIDFGCVYRISLAERKDLARAILALKEGDDRETSRVWHRITGFHTETDDPHVVARIAALALSHFDFSPIKQEALLTTLKRPQHRLTVAAQCKWLPPVQRCTEILRGDIFELGIRGVRLCDAWADLARECLEQPGGDDDHRTWLDKTTTTAKKKPTPSNTR